MEGSGSAERRCYYQCECECESDSEEWTAPAGRYVCSPGQGRRPRPWDTSLRLDARHRNLSAGYTLFWRAMQDSGSGECRCQCEGEREASMAELTVGRAACGD